MPMPPPTRIAPAAPGDSSRGAEKLLPSGPLTQTRSPGSELAEAIGARADALDQEVEADAARRPESVSATEKARGRKGRLPRSSQCCSVASM